MFNMEGVWVLIIITSHLSWIIYQLIFFSSKIDFVRHIGSVNSWKLFISNSFFLFGSNMTTVTKLNLIVSTDAKYWKGHQSLKATANAHHQITIFACLYHYSNSNRIKFNNLTKIVCDRWYWNMIRWSSNWYCTEVKW